MNCNPIVWVHGQKETSYQLEEVEVVHVAFWEVVWPTLISLATMVYMMNHIQKTFAYSKDVPKALEDLKPYSMKKHLPTVQIRKSQDAEQSEALQPASKSWSGHVP